MKDKKENKTCESCDYGNLLGDGDLFCFLKTKNLC